MKSVSVNGAGQAECALFPLVFKGKVNGEDLWVRCDAAAIRARGETR